MEQEELNKAILERFNNLQPEIQEIIMSTTYEDNLYGIAKKYNLSDEQFKELELNTTLVLLGNTHPEEYKNELVDDLKITEELANKLILDIDEKILNKVLPIIKQNFIDDDENEKKFYNSDLENLDARFSNMPRDVQEAIAVSGWKEKIYQIAKKYSLTVEKMGVLEDITVRTLSGQSLSEQYENEVKGKVGLPEDKTKEMVAEINESIFKQIKDFMRNNSTIGEKTVRGVPLPPYVVEKKESIIPLPPQEKIDGISTRKSDIDMYREHGIEIISNEDRIESEVKKNEEVQLFLITKL